MALSEERRGQIALAIVKEKFRRDGLKLSSSARRELGALANEIKVPVEELEEFVFGLLPELIGNAFGADRVSVTCERKDPLVRVTPMREPSSSESTRPEVTQDPGGCD